MTFKSKISATVLTCVGIIAGAGICGCTNKNKATPSHEHIFNESVWAQDDTGHWRAATCGHGIRKEYGKHVYDDAGDADCNVCGRVRTTEENTDPAESNGEKPEVDKGEPDTAPAGFIIDEKTDGLLVEGVSAEYALNRKNRALNFNTLAYKVYLTEDGEKGEEVPHENFETKVYYHGKEVLKPQELTEDGRYSASVTLVGAYYEDGETVTPDVVAAKIKFSIDNGIEAISLLTGKTEQVSSENDKMSGSWTFEAERANGDKVTVDGSEVELLPPDTETVGTRTTTVKYAGIESEVEYTVKPVPEIISGNVDITRRGETEIVTDGEYAEIGVGDFKVEYSANAGYAYSVETSLVYGGAEGKNIRLEAGDKIHPVTVKVAFRYSVEGDTVTKVYTKEFGISVKKKPEETDGNRLFDGAEILNGNGAVHLKEQADFAAELKEGLLCIKYVGDSDFGEEYCGLSVDLNKPATVKVDLSVENEVIVEVLKGEESVSWQIIENGQELSLDLKESGEYMFKITLLNPQDTIVIRSVEIIYGQ